MSKIKIQVWGYHCDRCNHKWIPRVKINSEPLICPKCKSPYWNVPRKNGSKNKGAVKNKSISIGVCLKSENNPFWSIDMRKGIEDASKDYRNVRLIYKSPSRTEEIEEQEQILKSFIADEVDAIILAPSNPTKLIPLVKEINKLRIPIIIVDSRPDSKESEKYKLKYHFIGFDDYAGGYQTGKLFLEKLKNGSNVAIIEGVHEGSYTQRVDGFRDAIGNSLNLLEVCSAGFEEDNAYTKTKELLEKQHSIDAIFCTSDNMAMGCLTALSELNRPEIIVSGFDATYAGKLALQKGRLLSTVNTYPEKIGSRAIQIAHSLLNGQKVSAEIQGPIFLMTQESSRNIPKQTIQKREYQIVYPNKGTTEFDYNSLKTSIKCPIIIGDNMNKHLPTRIKLLNFDKHFIITDNTVKKLYGSKLLTSMRKQGLECNLKSFPAGEKNKTFTTLNSLASELLNEGITKNSCLILLGGGVVGNLAGFLAAILMRGVSFIHVPTTVMSQIDSTTGGKQAVNTTHGKNLLGTFYEPEFIYIDLNAIRTLPKREYHSGIAEAIKHGLCQSSLLLKFIKNKDYKKIVETTISLKTHLIDIDPRENNEGLILVYGHTIGHAIETASNHQLNHGESISLGMLAAAKISKSLNYCGSNLVELHEKLLIKQSLPIKIPSHIKLDEIMHALRYDKKRRIPSVGFVLLEAAGKVKRLNQSYLIPVEETKIKEVLESMYQ